MGLIYLLISILGESASETIDKLNFKTNKISIQQSLCLAFLAMSLVLLAFVFIAHVPLPRISLVAFVLMMMIGLISFGANAFDTLSLKADDISLREPLRDFEPIVAGLVGYALFPAERKAGFLLAFLLGAFIVYWGTHRRRLGKVQAKGMFYMLVAISLYGVLPSIYKVTLVYLPPVYLTLFRAIMVLTLTSFFFPMHNVRKISSKKLYYSLLVGIFSAIAAVATLYAISRLGVVLTMLLSLLGPFLRYAISYTVLKENVRKGELASSTLLALIVLVPIIR